MPAIPQNTHLPLLFGQPTQFARKYRWPLLILLAGALADGVTTFIALRQWGPEVEVHIVQRWASEILGVTAGVPLAKIGQVFFVILVAAWWSRWTSGLMILCGLLYGLAAVNNHYMWL